jgi:hypothetical protein
MKAIMIRYCKECPYFCSFPARGFDGECGKFNKKIADENHIPLWCRLQTG